MNLKEIQKPVKHLLNETDRLLIERVRSAIPDVNRLTELAPLSKGKKIRSTILFLLAGMHGSFSPHLAEIAASYEMFHLSSLIHDDVVDNSDLRRGEQTLRLNLGNHMSVLWGDFLFISSFTALNNLKQQELMDTTLDAARLMVEGQIIEMENSFNYNMKLSTYYDIISRKTSSLFSAVTGIAAALNGKSREIQQQHSQFGLEFGNIFQATDDMLDIFSENSGKDRFSDIKEGKITLPFILLLQECPDKEITRDFAEGNQDKLLDLFKQYNIEELSMKEINGYYRKARAFIDAFPDSQYKKSLSDLLEFIKYRDY